MFCMCGLLTHHWTVYCCEQCIHVQHGTCTYSKGHARTARDMHIQQGACTYSKGHVVSNTYSMRLVADCNVYITYAQYIHFYQN